MRAAVAGVDEVGRGCLAGPVVAAAVVLPHDHSIAGLDDSKRLSAKRRAALAITIRQQAVCWALGRAEVAEIDAVNILQASLRAMHRAVAALDPPADRALIDGNQCPPLSIPATAIVGGDGLEPAISAASIVAKVARDNEMIQLARDFPDYGFERHKGYGSREHKRALACFGVTALHRRTFAPVAAMLDTQGQRCLPM